MKTVSVGGKTYQIHALSALDAWEFHRKVAAIAPAVLYAITLLKDGDASKIGPALQVLGPAFAGLPREDAHYIMSTCLSHVTRQEDNGSWPSTRVFISGTLAYADITPFTIDVLMFEVARKALAGFMQELGTYLPQGPAQAKAGES